jgi:hypothetical protein
MESKSSANIAATLQDIADDVGIPDTLVCEVKKKWKIRMREKNALRRLWDYGLVYIAEIASIIARGLNGRPGMEEILVQMVDISEWLDFDFYNQVWYWDKKKTDMNTEQRKIGRCLGIAHRVGSKMTYWILTKAAKVIA